MMIKMPVVTNIPNIRVVPAAIRIALLSKLTYRWYLGLGAIILLIKVSPKRFKKLLIFIITNHNKSETFEDAVHVLTTPVSVI